MFQSCQNPKNNRLLEQSLLPLTRKLKKEAEFLEASFRAKAEYMEADASNGPSSPDSEDGCGQTGSRPSEASVPSKSTNSAGDKRRPFWEIFGRPSERKVEPELQIADRNAAVTTEKSDMESNDILCFAQLRRELIELEKRVQKSANDAQEEVNDVPDEANAPSPAMSVPSSAASKKENAITKSVEKVKETTTTVVQGTQLLAIDTGAAMGLLRRALIGDELTQKEKQALQRTLTDLASVVPIGILMLLPIPSTYGPDRLDLLRQLEKVKEMEVAEGNSEDLLEAVTTK